MSAWVATIVAGLLLAASPDAGAQPPPPNNAAQAKVDEVVAAYAAAWNEPDVAARRQLLEKAWATGGTYTDPTAHVEGREALVQHISGYQKSLPNTRIAPTSLVDVHHDQIRFTWKILKADGSAISEGMDFGVIDGEGRLSKIVGFFGPVRPTNK